MLFIITPVILNIIEIDQLENPFITPHLIIPFKNMDFYLDIISIFISQLYL